MIGLVGRGREGGRRRRGTEGVRIEGEGWMEEEGRHSVNVLLF